MPCVCHAVHYGLHEFFFLIIIKLSRNCSMIQLIRNSELFHCTFCLKQIFIKLLCEREKNNHARDVLGWGNVPPFHRYTWNLSEIKMLSVLQNIWTKNVKNFQTVPSLRFIVWKWISINIWHETKIICFSLIQSRKRIILVANVLFKNAVTRIA